MCDFCDELDTWASSLEYNLSLVLCQADTFFVVVVNREVLIPVLSN